MSIAPSRCDVPISFEWDVSKVLLLRLLGGHQRQCYFSGLICQIPRNLEQIMARALDCEVDYVCSQTCPQSNLIDASSRFKCHARFLRTSSETLFCWCSLVSGLPIKTAGVAADQHPHHGSQIERSRDAGGHTYHPSQGEHRIDVAETNGGEANKGVIVDG